MENAISSLLLVTLSIAFPQLRKHFQALPLEQNKVRQSLTPIALPSFMSKVLTQSASGNTF